MTHLHTLSDKKVGDAPPSQTNHTLLSGVHPATVETSVLLALDEVLHLIGVHFRETGKVVRRGGLDILFPVVEDPGESREPHTMP